MTYMRNNMCIRQFKKRLVKAFYELAAAKTVKPVVEPPELQIARAMLLAGEMIKQQTEVIEQQKAVIATIEPKANALDRLAGSSGTFCLSDAAKVLQIAPRLLTQSLEMHRWIFRRHGKKNWLGYQEKVQAGLLMHKVTSVPTATDKEYIAEQVRITARGLTKIAVMLGVRLTGQLDLFDRAA